jgi:hypothetical protein
MEFDYESLKPDGSLILEMRTKANWARMIAAIFTMAMFYASVCSTTCAIGFCPNQVQQTAGHDCDQPSSHHSDPSGHQVPDKPDCSQHQHPDLFLTKSGNLSQFQLSVVSHLNASSAAVSQGHSLILSMTVADAPDHAPPPTSNIPLYLQISVLRI